MALKNKFLHAYATFPHIPRGRLVTGILVGLLFAFSFYSVLYVCREAFRILFFVTEDYDVLVFSDHTVSLFNLILAYIAVIMGQSLCITYWFEVPINRYGKHALGVRNIIHDQRGMNSYFLSWFSRLALVFPLALGAAMGGLYSIRVFSGYKYVAALVIFVLFLHSWNSLRRVFNGKSFKWMIHSAVLISVLAFGLSLINIVDYRGLNETILSKNIFHIHHLKLPEAAHFYRMSSDGRRKATLWIAEAKDKPTGSEPLIYINHPGNPEHIRKALIPLDNLKDSLTSWDENFVMKFITHERYIIYINRDIQMKYINEIKRMLVKSNSVAVEYAVSNPDRVIDSRSYNPVFSLGIPLHSVSPEEWQEVKKNLP